MRFPISYAALGLLTMCAQAFAQEGLAPVGTWMTEDGRAKIRTELCGPSADKLCGYVVWLKEPLNDKGQPRTDFKNPDPAKRTRPSLGLELMSQLEPDDKTHYNGEIYNADDGKKYSVTISIEKAEELQVHGCLLKILCGSQTWTKVADLPIPGATKVVQTNKAKPAGGAPSGAHHETSAPAPAH